MTISCKVNSSRGA